MDVVIKEINESLKKIVVDLETRKVTSQNDLNAVNAKINEKVEEAKQYKSEVDIAKAKIKSLETDISALEVDLNDLNERFGKKDLNAIVEAGNKEINSKIIEKQNGITKHRQKIAELTERARSIKDLLLNLKKDKAMKEERLEILTKAFDYYSDSLEKVIDYAKNNPNSLNTYDINYNNLNFDYTKEPLTEVFDEIESMDKKDYEEESNTETEYIKEEVSYDDNALDSIYEKLKAKTFNFEEINKTIDAEYDHLFGNSNEINVEKEETKVTEEVKVEPVVEEPKEETSSLASIFADINNDKEEVNFEAKRVPDFFGNESASSLIEDNPSDEIVQHYSQVGLDFNKFSEDDKVLLKNIYKEDTFKNYLDVLKSNHISLESLYTSANIYNETTPENLGVIISKLLLAGQTTANIELVLDKLPMITAVNLDSVVAGYGPDIKEANITEIIMKAKKIAEGVGGAA